MSDLEHVSHVTHHTGLIFTMRAWTWLIIQDL